MGANSKIEWTHHTFNPWQGCTKVHEGCAHCYAESLSKRTGRVKWGPSGTRVKTSESYWRQPLKWYREAEAAGERRRVFCASLADVFEDWAGTILDHHGDVICRPYLERENTPAFWTSSSPELLKTDPQGWSPITLHDLRRELFALIDQTPWLDWLLLTKRPENVRRMWPVKYIDTAEDCEDEQEREFFAEGRVLKRLSNVWLGTSISNQETADRMVPELLKCRALCPVLFLSAEPLLGSIDLRERFADGSFREFLTGQFRGLTAKMNDGSRATLDTCDGSLPRIDWLIVGGESGPGARPMHPDWIRGLRDQCQAAGVPFFFKQWGEYSPDDPGPPGPNRFAIVKAGGGDRLFRPDGKFTGESPQIEDANMFRVGKAAAGRLLDGREWSEFPAVPTGPPQARFKP